MNNTRVNACNEYYTIQVHVPPTFEVYKFLPCSVFVATHPKMNTLGVSHVPCLQHKVPFQFIRVLNGAAH